MSYNQIYSIAAQGMDIEKLRVDVVAHNIAHQHTVKKIDGNVFQPSSVITTASAFESWMDNPEETTQIDILPQKLPPNKVYQPGHPAADNAGFVTYPGISTVDEMTTMLKASRTYEAHIKVMNTAHSLFNQALSIGEER